MIDLTIPFMILQIVSVGYCIFKVVQIKKQGKKIGLRVVVSILFPEVVLCYDFFKHILKYFKTRKKKYTMVFDDISYCMDGKP